MNNANATKKQSKLDFFSRKKKSDEKSVIEGEQRDDGTCTNVETAETVVHKKDEKEKDRALEVRVGDKKTVSEKATDYGIYLHETNQLKI